MLTVTPGDIEAALLPLIPQLATRVPDDILSGLVAAVKPRPEPVLASFWTSWCKNACVAAR